MGRVIGIDYGSKRSGVAMSDTGRVLATPVGVFQGEKALVAAIRRLVEQEDVDQLVVGLPLNMDGSLGPKARDVLAFRGRLKKEIGLPVDTSDERLTTVQADEYLREAGLSGRKRAQKVDQVAAQILL